MPHYNPLLFNDDIIRFACCKNVHLLNSKGIYTSNDKANF
jgi:hypothetical protein